LRRARPAISSVGQFWTINSVVLLNSKAAYG
jgi:hypothetical protein